MKKRFIPILVAAALGAAPTIVRAQEGALPGGQPAPGSVNPDTELLDAWWNVCRMVHQGEAWSECRDALAAATGEFAGSKYAPACRELVESIDLSAKTDVEIAVSDESSVDELIEALPATRLGYAAVLMPHQYHAESRRFEWDELAAEAGNDPALLLYLKGRSALPAILRALADRRATRTAISDRDRFRIPQVFLVSDVAVAMIEAISGCSFRSAMGQGAMISGLPVDERREALDAIRAWWSATRDMTPAVAALWHVQNSDRIAREQTIRSMLSRGWNDEALAYLADKYRNGRSLDYRLAMLALDAGSRGPLDFIHEQIEGGAALDQTMVRLIAAKGEPADFMLLADAVKATCSSNDRNAVRQIHLIVNELAGLADRSTIPVMVAVIERELSLIEHGESVTQSESQGYLARAAQQVQTLSGVNFGFDTEAREARRLRAYRDIAEWWRREGCGAYGFAQTAPYAPGGIR